MRLFVGVPLYAMGHERSEAGISRLLTEGNTPAFRTAKVLCLRDSATVLAVKPNTLPSVARAELLAEFLRTECDPWLMLDHDIYLGIEIVDRLLRAVDEGGDVVLATYPQRDNPSIYPLSFNGIEIRALPVRTLEDGSRVIPVTHGPLGACVVRRRVIEVLVKKSPELVFFHHRHNETIEQQTALERRRWAVFNQEVKGDKDGVPRYFGEDYAFLSRVRRIGYSVECLVDAPIEHDGVPGDLARLYDEAPPA